MKLRFMIVEYSHINDLDFESLSLGYTKEFMNVVKCIMHFNPTCRAHKTF